MPFCFKFFQTTTLAAPPKPSVTILVFKTNLRSILDIKAAEQTLAALDGITRWNVDSHDIDNVLRIVTTRPNPDQVIEKMREAGFFCQELPD